jgi:enoyl-CoA hydratase/carnithine racemase
MMYRSLVVETRGAIAEIRLKRPETGNAIDPTLLDELDHATGELSDNDGVHVVLLTADGDTFSRGWDRDGPPPQTDRRSPAFRCLELMAQPVIACVQGDAIGEGLELALACDVRIAAEDAVLAMPQVTMGAPPQLGGTARLPRLAGRSVASAMILLGQQLEATEALRCGLVSAVVPAGDLRQKAEELAAAIASQGPLGVRYAKEAIREGMEMPLTQALRYETDLTIILQTTDDRAEGVRAFMEKRRPKFSGK